MDFPRIFIYKILLHFKNIRLRIQDSLIFDGKDLNPMLLHNDSEGLLLFQNVTEYETILNSWFASNDYSIFLSSQNSINKISDLSEAISVNKLIPCLIKKSLNEPNHKINILWSSKNNYSVINSDRSILEYAPIGIRRDSETIKDLINKYMKKNSLRLKRIEIVFVVYQNSRYFDEIKHWKFSVCDSLKRFHNLNSGHSKKSSLPKIILSPRLSPTSIKTPVSINSSIKKIRVQTGRKNSIEEKIKKIVEKNNSVKYINYKSWKQNIDYGNILLPNEELFAKMIARDKIEHKKYDCVKEIRNLYVKMAINMDENKSKRHLQEAVKQEILTSWILKHGLNSASLEKIQKNQEKKKIEKKVVFQDEATKELNFAVEKFETMKQKIKFIKGVHS